MEEAGMVHQSMDVVQCAKESREWGVIVELS